MNTHVLILKNNRMMSELFCDSWTTWLWHSAKIHSLVGACICTEILLCHVLVWVQFILVVCRAQFALVLSNCQHHLRPAHDRWSQGTMKLPPQQLISMAQHECGGSTNPIEKVMVARDHLCYARLYSDWGTQHTTSNNIITFFWYCQKYCFMIFFTDSRRISSFIRWSWWTERLILPKFLLVESRDLNNLKLDL